MGLKDGQLAPIVQEITLNSYTRFDGFNIGAADAYWAKTKEYWAGVRAAWNGAIVAGNGVYVPEQANNGSASGERLMTYADEVDKGTLTTAQAIIQARAVIGEVTKPPPASANTAQPAASTY